MNFKVKWMHYLRVFLFHFCLRHPQGPVETFYSLWNHTIKRTGNTTVRMLTLQWQCLMKLLLNKRKGLDQRKACISNKQRRALDMEKQQNHDMFSVCSANYNHSHIKGFFPSWGYNQKMQMQSNWCVDVVCVYRRKQIMSEIQCLRILHAPLFKCTLCSMKHALH